LKNKWPVEIAADEKGILKCLYFPDEKMKEMFKAHLTLK
jgi:hypothetical protein